MGKIVKFLKRPDMLRLTLTRSVIKCLVALAFVLLWRYFFNQALSIVQDGFFVIGVIFLVMAWFSYLGWDGIEAPWSYFSSKNKRKKTSRKQSSDMIDYVEEDVVTMEDLSDEERHICALCSSLFVVPIFLIPSLCSSLLAMR